MSIYNDYYSFVNLLDTPYCLEIREWRNQDHVRRAMINQRIISKAEHLKYIELLKKTNDQEVFVMMRNSSEPLGVISIKWSKKRKEVSTGVYLINEEDLDSGIGVIMRWAVAEYIFTAEPDVIAVVTVLKSNLKALRYNIIDSKDGVKEYSEVNDAGEKVDLIRYNYTRSMWLSSDRKKVQKLLDRVFGLHNISPIVSRRK